jgi:hypothetical protein
MTTADVQRVLRMIERALHWWTSEWPAFPSREIENDPRYAGYVPPDFRLPP